MSLPLSPNVLKLLKLLAPLLLSGCMTTQPSQVDDVCAIFAEKRGWYRQSSRAQQRWDVPIHIKMAFMHKESTFAARARPERTKLLWVIPWRRPSSAYGFAQATNAAWSDYQRATGRTRARRNNFGHAMDFIGWYNHESARRLGIPKHDAYRLYLAYHEGHGGYARGSFNTKPHVQDYARRVAQKAARYESQLQQCESRLRRRLWLPFL